MMEKKSKPNIVLLVLDTLRKDRLSCYGCKKDLTPNLDALSDQATVYSSAISNSPWTLPSHASFFTGKYPSQHGATQQTPFLEDEHSTVAEVLAEQGYETACFTCNSWITPYTKLNRGFKTYRNFFKALPNIGPLKNIWKKIVNSRFRKVADKLVSLGNSIYEFSTQRKSSEKWTPEAIEESVEFVENSEKPFFLFVNLMDTHMPYTPPEEFLEKPVDTENLPQNPKEYNSGRAELSEERLKKLETLYNGEVSYVDDQIQELISKTNDENTMFIVVSDHGENLGEHGFLGHEFCVYDELLKVPLIIDYPDKTANEDEISPRPGEVKRQVDLRQLFHTILSVTGVPVDHEKLDGGYDPSMSLLGREGNEFAFIEYFLPEIELNQLKKFNPDFSDPKIETDMRSVRTPEWKYIWYENVEDELFNLKKDPEEQENVIKENPEKGEELLKRLENGFDSSNLASQDSSEVLEETDPLVKERLKKLGYI